MARVASHQPERAAGRKPDNVTAGRVIVAEWNRPGDTGKGKGGGSELRCGGSAGP